MSTNQKAVLQNEGTVVSNCNFRVIYLKKVWISKLNTNHEWYALCLEVVHCKQFLFYEY